MREEESSGVRLIGLRITGAFQHPSPLPTSCHGPSGTSAPNRINAPAGAGRLAAAPRRAPGDEVTVFLQVDAMDFFRKSIAHHHIDHRNPIVGIITPEQLATYAAFRSQRAPEMPGTN